MKRVAIITGINGQDGSYLAELLLEKGYEVHGTVRRAAVEDPDGRLWRISHLLEDIHLHTPTLDSHAALLKVVTAVRPDECYHLAAQSFVGHGFEDEFATVNVNINATHYLLSVLKQAAPDCRFYFAGSSEMFGHADSSPQCESTPFRPRAVYGITKVAGFDLTRNYRRAYGLHATSGILFNHESPRRGPEFVTRKITRTAARIKLGLADELKLGNLEARRDWGDSRRYVQAMWLMLQQDEPDDYVIATGQTHSVRDFCQAAFGYLDLDYRDYVTTDPRFFRPAERCVLCGDTTKAKQMLQ